MGQHLHLYAKPSFFSRAEIDGWCSDRAHEYERMPSVTSDAVREQMWAMERTEGVAHMECDSTWAVTVWSSLVWRFSVVTPELIARLRQELEYAMLTMPAMPGPGREWTEHPIFNWLERNMGLVIWGDNDGI